MTWTFGDSWDFYLNATGSTDPLQGYWDGGSMSVNNNCLLATGRFTGSLALSSGNTVVAYVFKNSGSNDPMHHINIAFLQAVGLTSSTLGIYIQLLDGSTGQCAIVFRSDGAIVLTSSTPGGSTLATYTGAFNVNVWTAFEFEVVINSSTGSFTVRKNGNTTADFTATNLNTRGGTSNNYASRLQLGLQSNSSPLNANNAQKIDDVLWRSDPSSVSWAGDVRAAQMMPTANASAQFTPSTTSITMGVTSGNQSSSFSANTTYIDNVTSYSPTRTGSLVSLGAVFQSGFTGHAVMGLYDNTGSGGSPGSLLVTSNAVTNPVAGANTFTLASPLTVTAGRSYYFALLSDTTFSLNYPFGAGHNPTAQSSTTYPSLPSIAVLNASAPGNGAYSFFGTITVTNWAMVNDAQEDGTSTYVYSNTVGQADFYNLTTIPTTSTVVAVNTRGFICKGDVGTRSAQLQLTSGSTTVQTSPLILSTSFQWLNRVDTVDPNTGSAWSATNLNAIAIGPLVTS